MFKIFFVSFLLTVQLMPSHAERPGLEVQGQCLHAESVAESLLQMEIALKPSKFAYVWYLADSDTDIACAILVAASAVSSNGVRPNTDLAVIYNDEVPGKERFEKRGIKLIKVEEAAAKGTYQWKESFLKLRAAQLFNYDRVIYFDADAFPLGSIDNLFDIAKFQVEIAAPRAYWLEQPFVQSGGPMVIDPNKVFYKKDFLQPMQNAVGQVGGEMDWVNTHFRDTVDILDGFYALLIGEWCGGDTIYQHWQHYFEKSPEWVMEKAVMVHFIADWKPWSLTSPSLLEERCPKSQPQLLQIFQRWWNAKAEVC